MSTKTKWGPDGTSHIRPEITAALSEANSGKPTPLSAITPKGAPKPVAPEPDKTTPKPNQPHSSRGHTPPAGNRNRGTGTRPRF